jgi:glycosyltransferase involved in cell wall biosynthesis
MRVGVNWFTQFALDSIRGLSRSLYETLAERHELVFLPHEYPYVSGERRLRMLEEFLQRCDVVAGTLNPAMLAVRQRMGIDVPFAAFLLGTLPRGGWAIRNEAPYLTTHDVLLVNCGSDVELARRFIPNAQVRVVPFAYDPASFYALDDAARGEARRALGFGEGDRVILYAGRVTPEKNVHTLLRMFAALAPVVPEAHLVVAGSVSGGGGFMEFGVAPLNYATTVERAVSRLDLPRDRLHLLGHAGPDRLRELYNAADVLVNLTLHHDENFGMAQVEAMACGTPVVGTAWGGLKDTVLDGVTGHLVSVAVTPTGVKADWWEALNRTAALLRDPGARARFRDACVSRAAECYAPRGFAALMEDVLERAAASRGTPAEPVRTTEFAAEYWALCDPRAGAGAPYRRGPRSEEMSRALVTPFAGASREHVPADAPLAPEQVLSLATALADEGEGRVRVDSPFYPFAVEVPPDLRAGVHAVLAVLRGEPVATVKRLSAAGDGARGAIGWMVSQGMLLRTRPVRGWVAPGQVGPGPARPLFNVLQVDRATTDFLVY